MTAPIRVVVADDQALVRGSFRVLVDSTSGMVVVGEAANGADAVQLTKRERPDVVLMDIRMPVMDGLEATRQICKLEMPVPTHVLVLTTFDVDSYVYDALRAGASGFLLKDSPPEDLLSAIRVVARGDALIAPSITRRLIAEFAQRPDPVRPIPVGLKDLTERETDVLVLIAGGLSNLEIAERLVISRATVKTHVGHLLSKLEARDRAQLVIAAYESGLTGSSKREPSPGMN